MTGGATEMRALRLPMPTTASTKNPAERCLPADPIKIAGDPMARVYVGDCREIIPTIRECQPTKKTGAGVVDLVFADPPFNWNRAYDKWEDNMAREDYLQFTRRWLDLCRIALRPGGAFWVNIPDDTAAEIVVHLKSADAAHEQPALEMVNWCIWHYRFGQNTKSRFINSKVHALYFVKPDPTGAHERTWDPTEILEPTDRATTYFDPRTLSKRDGMPAGRRVPLDVWYGPYWGRIQGNNKERRHGHDNQLPEAYLERVLLATSRPGDLVMDPFLGSGTTGVVARALGRRFIGTEYSKENAERSIERIERGPIDLGKARGVSTSIHKARPSSKQMRESFKGL